MKKKLLTILITSVVMLVGIGVFLWKMNGISEKINKHNEAVLEEEKDLVENQDRKAIDSIDDMDIIPLYLSGKNKNVITVSYDSASDVYNVDNSARAEEMITDIKKKTKKITIDEPLWAYNLYGTNTASMYVYFNTSGRCYCRYTVSVKDKSIPDFTRTLLNNESGNLTKEHEYQIIGLVPGKTNFITLNLYNKNDELYKSVTYRVRIRESQTGARTILDKSDGNSKKELSNGLYTVFSQGKRVKKTSTKIITKKTKHNGRTVTKRIRKKVAKYVRRNGILLYDNSGVLRGEIPLSGEPGRNMEIIYNNIFFACSSDKYVSVNSLGQVVKTYQINGYKTASEFAYDNYGDIYVAASPLGKNSSPKSVILKLQLESGNVTEALNMETLLPKVYAEAARKAGKKTVNWIDVNSLAVTDTNELLISSRATSAIMKVKNVNSLMPKVIYIIGDKNKWKKYPSLYKKVLKKKKML